MNWKLSLPEPQMLVYYFAKLTGLAPLTVNKNYSFGPPRFLDVLYTISIAAGYSVFTVLTWTCRLEHIVTTKFKEFPEGALIFQHFQSIPSVILTLMMFLLMHGKTSSIMNKLLIISIEFKSLGIVEDTEIFFKNLLATIITGNVVLIAICVVLGFVEPNWQTIVSIQYGMENWFIFNTGLIFVQLLIYIRQRFALLNEKLLHLFTPTRDFGSPHDLQMHFGGENPRDDDLRNIQRVQKIEGLHLTLCRLVDQTTHLFTTSIIFISLRILSSLSLNCSWTFYLIRKLNQLSADINVSSFEMNSFFCVTIRTIIPIIELYTVAYVSATTSKEGNAMKDMLSRVWDKTMSLDLQDEFFTFKLQLEHESGSVSILGFFDLGYSYVYKILCAVAAYVIVIIQFNGPNSPRIA